MGAYGYCGVCDTPHREPTVLEILEQHFECSACGGELNTSATITDVILDLVDRVEWLENHRSHTHGPEM